MYMKYPVHQWDPMGSLLSTFLNRLWLLTAGLSYGQSWNEQYTVLAQYKVMEGTEQNRTEM